MRTLLLSGGILSLVMCHGQLINGSFEQNGAPSLDGWTVTSTCVAPTSSGEVPGGTGSWSVRLLANSPDCQVVDPFTLAQPLPWIASGEWILSGWIKAPGLDEFEPTRVYMREGTVPPFFTQYGGLWHGDTTWAFVSQIVTLPPEVEPDSLWLVVFPSAVMDPAPHYAYVDALSLAPNSPTAIRPADTRRPAFRPNPASDHLWVDVPQPPSAITVIDARGRSIQIPAFRHTGRTLEVDVSSLAPGLCVMMLHTSGAPLHVRFIKG